MDTPYILQLFRAFSLLPALDKGFMEVRRPVRGRLLRGPRPRAWMGRRIHGTHRVVRFSMRSCTLSCRR